jgi:hypothetical protein
MARPFLDDNGANGGDAQGRRRLAWNVSEAIQRPATADAKFSSTTASMSQFFKAAAAPCRKNPGPVLEVDGIA